MEEARAKRVAQLIRGRQNDHADWLDRMGSQLLSREELSLQKFVSKDGFGALRVLASSLRMRSMHTAHELALRRNSAGGLDFLLASLFASSQLSLAVFLREALNANVGSTHVPTDSLDYLPVLIASSRFRRLEETHRQLVLLQRNLLDVCPKSRAVAQRFNASEPFRFVYELECERDGVAPNAGLDDVRETLGPYWPLLAWRSVDVEQFGRDLESAADHRMSLITMAGDRMAPLDYVPFDLFPVELLYVLELRKREALPWPSITHPLLTPWLDFAFAHGPLAVDEWVEKVRAKSAEYGIEIVLD
jgi:hypothetical protein